MNWCGAAVDLSIFGLESAQSNTQIDVYPVSLLLFVRYPVLLYEENPWFRVYPYLGAGPSVVLGSLSTEALLNNGSTDRIDVFAYGLGYDARAGWAWAFSDRFQLFVEYRYLHSRMSGSNSTGGYIDLGSQELSTTISSHQVVSGVSYLF